MGVQAERMMVKNTKEGERSAWPVRTPQDAAGLEAHHQLSWRATDRPLLPSVRVVFIHAHYISQFKSLGNHSAPPYLLMYYESMDTWCISISPNRWILFFCGGGEHNRAAIVAANSSD